MPHWIPRVALLAVLTTSPRVRATVAGTTPPPEDERAPAAAPPPTLLAPPAGGATGSSAAAEVGIGALQLVAGYAAEIGGVAGVFALGLYPKGLGSPSDSGAAIEVGVLAPAFAAGAICGVGRLSRSYGGRCSTTFLGAYLGATAGALLGIAIAPSPGQDDTQEFVSSIYGVAGFLLFAPVGAVVGYQLGKEEVRPEPTPVAPPAPPMPTVFVPTSGAQRYARNFPAPTLLVPIVNLDW